MSKASEMDFIEQMSQSKEEGHKRKFERRIRHISSNKQINRWNSNEKIEKQLRRSIPMFSKGTMEEQFKIEEDVREHSHNEDELDFSDEDSK